MFALFGCVKENTTAVFLEPEKQQVQQTRLSLDEAQSEVENLLAQIDQTTRSDGVQRKVVDYYCIGKQNITRSDTLPEGDELLTYVFNFDNNNGHAIVAGDTRIISPVLALTDDGYLNPKEGVENPGLINFLALAEHYYETEIQRYEEENGTMQTPQTRIDINYTQWEWCGEWEVKQLLGRRTYLNWNQGSPFNNNIAKISGYTPH